MDENNRIVNILLDTNFLLLSFQFKIDLRTEFNKLIDKKYNLILLEEVYEELMAINKKVRGRKKQETQAAIIYYKSKEKINDFEKKENESVDDFLIRIAKEHDYIVATNDKRLKRRLKNQGINFIYLRQKSHFKSHRIIV
jgi:rRNA-processing protein FCF1